MIKDISKIRVPVLVTAFILFSALAITTVVDSILDREYTGFQLYRNHFIANRNLIEMGDLHGNVKKIVSELDLNFYLFMDSSLFIFFGNLDREYGESLSSLKDNWMIFTSSDEKISPYIIDTISSDIDSIHSHISPLVRSWHIFYFVILLLNIIIFILLLIIVYKWEGINNISGNSGVMNVRNALLEGQEKERLRISLELHDKVAQDLFASRMIINDFLTGMEDETAIQGIRKSLSLLDSSIKEVRDLSYSLRPPALQAIGLDSAIQSYIDSFSKKIEIPITFKAVGINNKSIDETVSINLYRILQETLNNTAKHAHAQNIDIKLIYTYPYLLLKIEDDGVGFKYVKADIKAKGRNQLGLPGINERVSLIGGELIINTDKGEGTRILIRVPVERNEKV